MPSACACRASSTVSASSAPSVRLTGEPLQRRCTIHVLRPFGRARRPSPGAELSHSTASRPSAAAKARARASVIFVLFAMVRSLPFDSVATGASRAAPVRVPAHNCAMLVQHTRHRCSEGRVRFPRPYPILPPRHRRKRPLSQYVRICPSWEPEQTGNAFAELHCCDISRLTAAFSVFNLMKYLHISLV